MSATLGVDQFMATNTFFHPLLAGRCRWPSLAEQLWQIEERKHVCIVMGIYGDFTGVFCGVPGLKWEQPGLPLGNMWETCGPGKIKKVDNRSLLQALL